ncbi:MAG: 2-oxopent-4-enoate hydratase [Deltaproteobacteria bacterium]|nr:2-oxopent-4-enoate hydratase [Deltaproteobacteria bacterium]
MDDKTIEAIVTQLLEAQEKTQPIPPLTQSYPKITIQDAYRIQFSLLEKKLKKGAQSIGWKAGVTGKPVMEQLGVNEPILGHLLDSSRYPATATTIPFDAMIQPGIEPEIAFSIKEELKGPNVNALKVYESVELVFPAVEIVDCRIKDWKVRIQDIIADNVLHQGILVGSQGTALKEMDLPDEEVKVQINGQIAATGTAKNVLGNPVNVVAWVANKLAEFETSLNPGDIIMTGSITRFIFVNRGDNVKVSFSRLGSLEFSLQ